jgi:hypothetical protein
MRGALETIGGISIEELERVGMSRAQIEYVRDTAFTFRQKLTRLGTVESNHGPAFIVEAFEQGLAMGIAEATRLAEVQKKIGLYWPVAMSASSSADAARVSPKNSPEADCVAPAAPGSFGQHAGPALMPLP